MLSFAAKSPLFHHNQNTLQKLNNLNYYCSHLFHGKSSNLTYGNTLHISIVK